MPGGHSLPGYSYLVELKSKNIISSVRDFRAIFSPQGKKNGTTAFIVKKLNIIMQL